MLTFMFFIGGYSQTNIVVGFNGGYTLASNNNNVLGAYNNINNNLTEEFKDLRSIYGIELGLTYRTGWTAVTMMYQNSRRKRTARGILDDDTVFENSLNYIMSSFAVGLELGPRNLNLGMTLGARNVNIKNRQVAAGDFRTIDKDWNLVSKFYLNIGARGNSNNSLALRPYFEFAWGGTDISNLNSSLIGIKPTITDRFNMIGISLIFYNGPQ